MTVSYGIQPLPEGRFRVSLPPFEHQLLTSLAEQLRPVVAGDVDVADAGRRLYPNAYARADDEMEYRELVGTSLVSERVRALATFSATLDRGATDRKRWTVELDEEELEAWRSAVQDGILVLAAILGILDDDEFVVDATEPNSVALDCLQGVQSDVIHALMSRLRE